MGNKRKRFLLYGADVENPAHHAVKFGLDFKLISKSGFLSPEYVFEVYGNERKIKAFEKVLKEACDYYESGPFVNSVRACLEEIKKD